MSEKQTTSFNQAWKDFLLVRPFTRNAQVTWTMDNNGTITKVETSPLKTRIFGDKTFIIDDSSCEGYVLAFPIEVVQAEMNEKIGKKLLGKTITKQQAEFFKGKLDADLKKTSNRLGCANDEELSRALMENNYWEALFSSHQIVEYRLHKLLLYKSSERDSKTSQITLDPLKSAINDRLQTFKHLIEINFLIGSINYDEYQIALNFNGERDNLAHKLLRKEIADDTLKTACSHGLELSKILEAALGRIIPKPNVIFMNTFTIHEIEPF
jgi:hypothetical protein